MNEPGAGTRATECVSPGQQDGTPHRGWSERAACIGTDPRLWFDTVSPVHRRRAREICAICPVRRECLDAAMDEEQLTGESVAQNLKRRHGIRGGMTPFERFEAVFPVEAREIRDKQNQRHAAARRKNQAGSAA